MKLTIQHGVSVEKALEYIENFLREQCGDYPTLKGNMNVYLTLKDNENRNCPENEKEFALSAETVIDVEQERRKEAIAWLKSRWEMFILSKKAIISQLESKIESDERYIETALEKGRKPENVEKRRVTREKNLVALEGSKERFALIQTLDEYIKQGKVIFYFRTYRNSKYSSDGIMEKYFVFENVDGYTGQFDGNYLKDTLPVGYNKINT